MFSWFEYFYTKNVARFEGNDYDISKEGGKTGSQYLAKVLFCMFLFEKYTWGIAVEIETHKTYFQCEESDSRK